MKDRETIVRKIEPDNIEQEAMQESVKQDETCVLIVDDDRITRMIIQSYIEDLGYKSAVANDGDEALSILNQNKGFYDVVILDREMPRMNGLEVVARMKSDPDLRKIPIIMATGSGRPEDIKEGIDAGVFYYLTKPIDSDVLKSVFSSALREIDTQKVLKKELKKHKKSFSLIHSATFYLHTISEAEDLAAFLANCFPDPERVITGLAELIINAVEHGNLKISYEEKGDLIERGVWREEINRRAQLPENKNKKVEVVFRKSDDELCVKILDEGEGFEWQHYLDIDPARASHNHGRGIAQAKVVSFDSLKYNASGNQVIAVVKEEEKLEW